jgi:hypothetical protein
MYFVVLGKNKILSKEEIKRCLGNNPVEADFDEVLFLKDNISKDKFTSLA